jgi:hypothetical protein
MRKPYPLLAGQIRHPYKLPDMILKCRGPIPGETLIGDENLVETDMYYLTNDFPKPHYIVIDRILNNYIYPEHPYCLVYLITHSDGYDNLKVTYNLYSESDTKLNLIKSYVTRDKFLVLVDNIEKFKVFGSFNLEVLRQSLDY